MSVPADDGGDVAGRSSSANPISCLTLVIYGVCTVVVGLFAGPDYGIAFAVITLIPLGLLAGMKLLLVNLFSKASGREAAARAAQGLCEVAICVLLIGWAAFYLFSAQDHDKPGWKAGCKRNMSRIWLNVDSFRMQHASFPAAYVSNEQGTALRSWRVSLLPYMEFGDEFRREYRFEEPWSSQHNRNVLDKYDYRREFQCASARVRGKLNSEDETSYVMIVGPGTISDGPTAVRRWNVTDGPENTILFVETTNSGIHWAEPRDLKFDEMSFRINDPDRPSISSHHPRGAYAVFCDGRVRFLKNDTDPKMVRALLTIAGGEDVSEFLKTLDEEAYY